LDELDARGEIYWSPTGNPRRKVYLDESEGVGVQDIWMDFRDAHNQNVRITGYPTEKNPDLLRRVIQASSNPGDLVLDCYAGSGTTLAVASQLGREWIGMDNSPEAISTILSRLAHGLRPMGDYVNQRQPKRRRTPTQSLFDNTEPCDKCGLEPTSLRKSYPDFALLVEKQALDEHQRRIAEWVRQLTPPGATAS
jgi:adenine-specific DNA-methyltransferase